MTCFILAKQTSKDHAKAEAKFLVNDVATALQVLSRLGNIKVEATPSPDHWVVIVLNSSEAV